MDKFKEIIEWTWLSLKLIFIIATIIIGIKIIIFLLHPLLPFSFFAFSPFGSFDWNPIATIFGAIVTGCIAWYAVYKTSELDRNARIFELKYKYYITNLSLLGQGIPPILKLMQHFTKDSECLMSRSIDNDSLDKDFEINSFLKLYKHLCKINKKFKVQTKDFNEKFKSFIEIYNYLREQICQHRYYIRSNNESYRKSFIHELNQEKMIYCVDEFLAYYKEKKNIDYNVAEIMNSFDDLKNIIEEEFELNEK